MKKLLFISNLFPDAAEPYRGLDNATVLHELRRCFDIRVISPRPWLPVLRPRPTPQARQADQVFLPQYCGAPYFPKLGGMVNHRWMAAALAGPVKELRKTFEWDVVVSSWLFPDACAVAKILGDGGSPLVAIAQGSDVHRYLRSPVRRRAILSCLQSASACITRSRSLAEMLHGAGIDRSKLVPIHNGIDPGCFFSGPEAGMTGERVLLFVGNLLPVKDPLFLIRCFADLVKIRPQEQLRLVMVGKGPMGAAVRTEAIKLGIAAQLTLTGPQDASQVGAWMRRSEMLCMTSRNEGLPNVVLEAQACGLPVVATNVGGIHECVDEDWKGTLVPLDNANAWTHAAADLLDHPADRQRIAILGASRNWAATAGLYRDVIEAAITPVRSP